MKVSNEDKVLIGVGAAGLLGLFFLWEKKKDQQTADELASSIPELEAAPSSGGGSSSKPETGATLDRNKLLKVGSKGLEVRELQRLLGVEIDGDFGKITLAALQNAKGVSQISLNAFSKLKKKVAKKTPQIALLKTALQPKVTLPKVGQKLMAAKDGTVIFKAKKIANGTYTNTGERPFFDDSLKYGDYVGVFKAEKLNGEYLIQRTGEYFFVKSNSVIPY